MGSLSPVPDFLSRNMQCEKVQPIYEIIIPQEKTKPKCVAGCKHFSDGEVYHHKDCFYYRLEEAEIACIDKLIELVKRQDK